MGKIKEKKKVTKNSTRKEIKVTSTQKRKAKRVAVSSVITAVILTVLTLLQIATVKVSNSDFPIGNIVETSSSGIASWKTFADNRYGFSFEYPQDNFMIVDDAENNYTLVPTDSPDFIADVPNAFFTSKGYDAPHPLYAIRVQSTDSAAASQLAPFTLWIFENRGMLNPDDWYNKYDYYPFAFAPHIPAPVDPERPIQNVLVSGLLGKYHLRVSDSDGEVAYLYILRKKTMFLIVVDKPEENGEMGNKILSTLRFFNGSTE